MPLESCIYCSAPIDPTKGEGDHIVPAQLGEFRGDTRFRRICPQCNNLIGRCEQQFLQCGPESFFREIVKPAVPRRRRRGRSRVGGAHRTPPPKFTMDSGDHTQLVKPHSDRPRDAEPVDHLVVRGDDGQDHHFPLFPGIRPEQLRKRLAQAGIQDFAKAWLHCDEKRSGGYQDAVRLAWPDKKLDELPRTEAGVHKARGRITFTFNEHYFSVIAKIAFHYYLVHTRRGFRGDEPAFDAIRRFIMESGDVDSFFHSSGPTFAVPLGKLPSGGAVTPRHWCHVLAADETSDTAVAYVHLFAGPGCVRRPHYITLARLKTKITLPMGAWGHVYQYDEAQPPVGFAGRVLTTAVTRLR